MPNFAQLMPVPLWGAGFGRGDRMHFEVSGELIRRRKQQGVI